MKKQILFLATTVITSIAIAQAPIGNLIPCNTYNAMQEGFKADPTLKQKYEDSQLQLEAEYQQAINQQVNMKTAATVYTIPVVFHIMGSGHAGNVSDVVFSNLISYLNNDYAKTGNDVSTINSSFSSLYVDAEVRFALAKKDPNGKCTNGIIHHDSENKYWNQDSPTYNYSGTGTNRWPTNKYLNIYIVECIYSPMQGIDCPTATNTSYVGGYTYLPGSTFYTANGNMGDAIVLLSNFGALAQNDPHQSRTIAHEIGHWFNLKHTFGDSNSPVFGNSNPPNVSCGSATLNDGVSDTPETKGYFSICTPNSADCTTLPNIENIMDYSSCPKMFTQLQVTKMRTALTSAVGGRSNLWTNTNLTATGLSGALACTPVADFSSNKTIICSSQSVIYTSSSQVGNAGSVSWTFQGGTPATSSATQVTVTYPSAGIYSVSIVATNGSGTNTMNKTSYLNAVNGSVGNAVPVAHSFEDGLIPSQSNVINANTGSVAWAIKTGNGANGTSNSIYLNNITANTAGQVDSWETPIYNLSNVTNLTLSYWYAYAKKTATQTDTFKLQYSLDCGGSWTNVLGFPNTSSMANNSGGVTSSAFNPTSVQWKQTNIISALLSSLNNKPSVKLRFYFRAGPGGANNIYFDEINLNGTVGINELENNIGLSIYPNPTNASATVDFNTSNNETVVISVTDVLGRTIETSNKLSSTDNHIAYMVNKQSNLAKGVYIINLDINQQRISKKLIIE